MFTFKILSIDKVYIYIHLSVVFPPFVFRLSSVVRRLSSVVPLANPRPHANLRICF